MKQLSFRYHLLIEFDQQVTNHRFTVKCMPQSDARQSILHSAAEIYPRQSLCDGRDSFGNLCVFGHTDAPHEKFEVLVTGQAATDLAPAAPCGDAARVSLYRYQTDCTRPGDTLTRFYRELALGENETAMEKSCRIARSVHEAFVYTPGATAVGTTAEQALSQGRGVCQDYAHVMLSLCRMAGIPCRYVVGMMLGEGQSHAWVEIAHEGFWYAFDPTNAVPVAEQHIKISHGRDYGDCLINQGMFTGVAAQRQTVSVIVEKI